MRLAPAVLLALVAPPALAQDLSGQFAGAVRAFTLPGTASVSPADVAEDDAILALLPRLAGDWAPLHGLFPDPMGFDPDLLAESCERIATTLVPTADRSFEMRRSVEREGGPVSLTVRYDWVIGNSFDRGVAEQEVMAYMGLDARGEVSPGMLAFPNMRGPAQLFYPGADVLVIVAPHQSPEFWGRCPD